MESAKDWRSTSEAREHGGGTVANELIHPKNEGFVERVTPKAPGEDVFFFQCPNCRGHHFRHAGYIETMLPFMRSGGEKRVSVDSHAVKLCVKCKHAYIWLNEQMYDVTDKIDLDAWMQTEVEAHRATGPGGQC